MNLADMAHRMAVLWDASVISFQPLDAGSRNTLARVLLATAAGEARAVLKVYDPDQDPHWANRCRREEKTLTLLADADPPIAPRPLAGWIAARGPAALMMEDAGSDALADTLRREGSPEGWRDAADFLARLHARLAERAIPLRRTALAIELDRINGPALLARMRTASIRVLGVPPETAALRDMRVLMAPVLSARRAVVHNSLSPLNVVVGEAGFRAVDWETLAVASPVWDWAELLRAPYHPLPFEESERLFVEASGLVGQESLFRRAVFSRHVDSLGVVVRRQAFSRNRGSTAEVAEYARRARFYADDLDRLVEMLPVSRRLLGWWWAMKEGALG